MDGAMSEAVTRGIRVSVRTIYVPARSAPQKSYYFFAYQVTIANEGLVPVQLLARYWVITDGTGKTEEVAGPGVVGVQPRIEAGGKFQYTSYCPLPTQVGNMCGSYQMVLDDGEGFDATVAPFTLAAPHALN